MFFDESKEDRALDAGDFDKTNGTTSYTDRLCVFANRIAQQVHAKNPDIVFGMLAYANYIRPPVREKLHPSIVPHSPATCERSRSPAHIQATLAARLCVARAASQRDRPSCGT